MRRLLLTRIDLVLFVATTVGCGLIVRCGPSNPCLLALLAAPIIVTAVFGAIREKIVGEGVQARSCHLVHQADL